MLPTEGTCQDSKCCQPEDCRREKLPVLPEVPGLKSASLSCEAYREYEWVDDLGRTRTCRITNPVGLYFRSGGSTHRVVCEDGSVKCLPAPGFLGCVLTWKNRESCTPVQF